jgi:hypothetical protein
VKTAAGTFLGGAKSRLLPASVPLRFFGAAVFFHLLAWLALLAGSSRVPYFMGGLDWPLAALHLVTLGVLVMSAIGASLQLLPVATRQPVLSRRGPATIWWLYAPGVALLTLGMGLGKPLLLAIGAGAVVVALVVYAWLLARNLRSARGMPGVVAHGWAALVSLLVLAASALLLAATWIGAATVDRETLLTLHVAFAAYGFMGMLALGLSYILVPMFALASAPDERGQIASFTFAVLALVLVALAAAGVVPRWCLAVAIGAGAVAVTLHLRLMARALATGMRRELGRSFRLVRCAWGALAASLAVALAIVLEAPIAHLANWFGLLVIGGWLLTFLCGILQRILPFLASMHAGPGVRPPTPSSLTFERPLAVHFGCHLTALALLAVAIGADSALIAALAAGIGTAGALAFGVFFVVLVQRMHHASASTPTRAPAEA